MLAVGHEALDLSDLSDLIVNSCMLGRYSCTVQLYYSCTRRPNSSMIRRNSYPDSPVRIKKAHTFYTIINHVGLVPHRLIKQCVEAFRRAQILSAQSGSSAYGGSLPKSQLFLYAVLRTVEHVLRASACAY
jgi:hypothetical protein